MLSYLLGEEHLKEMEEEWVVVQQEGGVIREEESLSSRFISVIEVGTTLGIAKVRGNRILVIRPLKGWMSVISQTGEQIVDRQNEPDGLCCPITKMMFKEPVMVPHSGYTYEKNALMNFWQKTKGGSRDQGWPRDPMTNVQLPDTSIHPNIAVRVQVAQWLQYNAARIPEGWTDRIVPPLSSASSTPPPEGGRFGGFVIGQKICVSHSSRNVKRGDIGIFKGPIKPYDRAIAEGLVEILWDREPDGPPTTVPLKDVAPMDKRWGILRRVLSEQRHNGNIEEGLEERVQQLADALNQRDRFLEEVTVSTVEKCKKYKSWAPEGKVCEIVIRQMGTDHKDVSNEEVLGELQLESVHRVIKRLARAGTVEKSTTTQEGIPFRARLLRISQVPKSAVSCLGAALIVAAISVRLVLDEKEEQKITEQVNENILSEVESCESS